jgi:hypothetical protein
MGCNRSLSDPNFVLALAIDSGRPLHDSRQAPFAVMARPSLRFSARCEQSHVLEPQEQLSEGS